MATIATIATMARRPPLFACFIHDSNLGCFIKHSMAVATSIRQWVSDAPILGAENRIVMPLSMHGCILLAFGL